MGQTQVGRQAISCQEIFRVPLSLGIALETAWNPLRGEGSGYIMFPLIGPNAVPPGGGCAPTRRK